MIRLTRARKIAHFHIIAIWCAAIIAVGVGTFAYREHLHKDAHWIIKVLCEGRPVFSGEYSRCLKYYAPAGAGP